MRQVVTAEIGDGQFAEHVVEDRRRVLDRVIATISAGVTLRSGDVIATGTPAGVGIGFDPPRYLKPGDVMRVEIDGIGVLENPVREAVH